MEHLFQALAVTGICLVLTGSVSAQTQNAEINGNVTDAQGALIPKAAIVVTNLATGVVRTLSTNDAGHYAAPDLKPGPYRVEVSKTGFQKTVTDIAQLDVNQKATLNIRLTVGKITESIQVSAQATTLDLTTAQLGTVITKQNIVDLPLNARNFTQLLSLIPGAGPVSVAQNKGGDYIPQIGAFIFPAMNGQSNRSNYFTLDGVYNSAPQSGEYAVAPNVDALEEFKVQSHSDQSEFGGVTGAVVNIATKAGTNQFHGNVYEFIRNDALDARNFFAAKKASLRQNQFGTTFGGPIVPNKLFFFFSYEGYRKKNPSNALYNVPTANERSGDFSGTSRAIFNPFTTRANSAQAGTYLRDPFPGNRIPSTLFDSTTSAFLNTIIPQPIDTGVSGYNGRNTMPQTFPFDQFNGRMDYQLTSRDSVWFRMTHGAFDQQSANTVQGTTRRLNIPSLNIGGSYTHIFGSHTMLNLLFGYSSTNYYDMASIGTESLIAKGLFKGYPVREGFNSPDVCVSSKWGCFSSAVSSLGPQGGRQMRGDFSHIVGRHSLKLGFETLRLEWNRDEADGQMSFNSLQTADLNNPGNTGIDLASFMIGYYDGWTWDQRRMALTSTLINAYVQDSWRVSDRLTVNLGLRWDTSLNPYYHENFPSTWDFNNGKFVVGSTKPPKCGSNQPAPCLVDPDDPYVASYVTFTGSTKLRKNDYRMFGPRLGLAYRVSPTIVARGGYGIFYDLQAGITQQGQNISGSWPGTTLIYSPSTINRATVDYLAANPFGGADPRVPAANPSLITANMVDPNIRYPYSQQWNAGLQKEISGSLLTTLEYAGSHSLRLAVGGPYNTALTPGPGTVKPRALWTNAPVSNWDRSIGKSTYHSLQMKIQQRLSKGLSYLVAYTWSKSIDVGSSGQFTENLSIQDPYHPFADRAVSGFDLPHNFSSAVSYALPFGKSQRWLNSGLASRLLGNWQMNGMLRFRSGQPYTVTMNIDVANIGSKTTRPNLVGNPVLANPTRLAWFDKTAYASPAVYNFGSGGRNQLRADSFQGLDASLLREDRIGERVSVQLRVEAFSVFNHPIFGLPTTTFNNANFGRVSGAGGERQLQLGMKVGF